MRMDCYKLRHIFSVFLNQRQHDGERRTLVQFAIHRYGAVGNPHTIDMRRKVDMRLNVSTSIDVTACETDGDNLLFLGFHGFSNDENEMIRIIDAIYDVPKRDVSSTDNSIASAQHPNYLSFRGTYERPYIGSYYWYPDGCSVGERRHECSAVGDAVVRLLDSPVYVRFRKVLIGFSQGGYLSYRMIAEHPDVFDMAILMSPSFKGEAADLLPATGRTRFALCYGSEDRTIPLSDQQCARNKLAQTGNLTYFEYLGMAHGICNQEIHDLRAWLGL